jgi:anaerobic magnesium-protoporphyrin IX monomethyl ester cyclase
MVNFCFIQPPSSLLLEDKVQPPLGILYLCAWLRKHGHEVSIVDLAGVPDWKQTMNFNDDLLDAADIVGITATTPQYNISKDIRDWIRFFRCDPPKVVIGGIHTTSLAYANEMDFLQNDGFDGYCIGEGYNAVTRMADDYPNIKRMYSEPILKDVNELPFAARDLIDIKSYKYKLGDVPTTTYYTQYGCYYECSYCESKMAGSYVVRAMHPQRIQDELRHVRDTYGIKGAMIFDDEMNLDKKRLLGICEKIKELGDIVWRGFMVTAKFDSEIAQACKEANCYEVASGIESGSPTILKNIKKPATVELNRQFLITAKKAGLRTKAFMIIGLPGESWSTIKESYTFLNSLGNYRPDDVDFSILQVYKGSNIYKTPYDVQFEDYDSDKMYYKSSPDSYTDLIQVRTKEMSKYDLVAARNFMESEFKKQNWIKDYSDRKDLDEVYKRDHIEESISYARKKLQL